MATTTAYLYSDSQSGSGWSSLSNLGGISGYAYKAMSSPGLSAPIYVTDFDFAVPTGSTINGITVKISRSKTSGANNIKDETVQLMKSSSPGGDNNALTYQQWSISLYPTVSEYGGSSDLWGLSWSPSDINGSGFGVKFEAEKFDSNSGNLEVDYIAIKVTYTPPPPVSPTVTTQAVSAIEATTATGNGNITDDGDATVTRRGFCYKVGTSGDPNTGDSVAYDDGSFGAGAYTKGLTGLSPGTSYRVRAYAVNSAGTGYGTVVQILTKPAAPTSVAATDGAHTDKVVVTWTKSVGATGYQIYRDGTPLGWLGDVATGDDAGADAPVITPGTATATDGVHTDKVVLALGGESVANGTTHVYKVRAKNATGEGADSSTDNGYRGAASLEFQWQRSSADSDASYSNIVGATTEGYDDTDAPANGDGRYYKCVLDATGSVQATSAVDRGYRLALPPTVTTQAATDVGPTIATGNGNITDGGGDSITQHGVCWKLGSDPVNIAGADDSTTEGVGSEGAFDSSITGLTESSTYYYRAYATNSIGTSYGAAQIFNTTASSVAPTVTTQAVTDIAYDSATCNGNITDLGGATVTRRGFCYKVGVTGDPTTADGISYDDGAFGTGAYTKALTGLGEETSYRVRSYAVNTKGTSYGVTVQMLTKVAAPTSVAATDGTHTDKVTVTWTKSVGATGYQIYRDGTPLGWLGDVATGDDAGADAPVITPGTADASDDTSTSEVTLVLSGESVANGTTHVYKVRAKTATDESDDSATDNGYRGHGAITYQWQRSAADSDADYSNIVAATTDPYSDTGAPSNGDGRYYRCRLDATGAARAISAVDRGYRAYGLILAYVTLVPGAETTLSDCVEHTDLSRVTSLSLNVEMTFDADVGADPTISIFASPERDDDEYDTSAWGTWTFPRSVGNTVVLHWPHSDEIGPLPKYIKIKVKNNSGSGANTSITSIKIKKVSLEL